MADWISKATIEELRARNDIQDVVGSYLDLKRAGSALKALCPFHKEKTPSFQVNPQRQIFHCFGCGMGGDVFRFVMEYEGVDFPTALRLLADRSGMALSFEDGAPSTSGPRKDVLFKVLDKAASMFHQTLLRHSSAGAAREYLAGRELDAEAIAAFRIGYAPNIRGALESWGRQAGVSTEAMESAGLLARSDRDGSLYERFRDRVMFPITDEMGRTIGFSGRVMDKSVAAKYVNSPETPVFHKNRVLFALDKARHAMVEGRVGIVCEGQIDAIRCHQAGFANVVASQGTAISEFHARLLNRYADEVVLVLDSDRAGQDAAVRSAEVFLAAGLTARIAALPPGEDPDSLIRSQGPDALRGLVQDAKPLVDFFLGVLGATEDLTTETGRNRAVKAVLESIGRIPGAVQRDTMLRQLSRGLYIPEHVLRDDLGRRRRGRQTTTQEPPRPPPEAEAPTTEMELLELLASAPDARTLVGQYLPLQCLTNSDAQLIAEHLLTHDDDPGGSLTAAVAEASATCQRLAARIQMGPRRLVGDEATPERVTRDLILCLRRQALERQRDDLRIRAGQASGAEQDRLTASYQQLSMDIHQLRQGWDASLPILELD